MIKLFGQTDRDFTSNGDKVIQAVRAKVVKQDNGDFYLDLETDLSYVNDLTEGRIVIAPTPQGEQPFRVSNVQKTKKKLTIKCPHVFFDSKNYLIADSYVVEKNCNDALDHLNSATTPQSAFTTISDVNTVSSFRCVRKSLYEAIQTVLERWGGHLVRDNFSIGIRSQIGQDNGVTVRYAKNLKEITVDENWDAVVTQLMPVGKDGLLLNAADPSASLYMTSAIQYDIPYTKTISFDQNQIVQEDYVDDQGNPDTEAYQAALLQDLELQAQAYLNANSVPQVNYTLSANLEKVTDIGDTVYVEDERLGLTVQTNVIAYTYDCILGKYIELQFGNFMPTLSNLTTTIANQTQEIVNEATSTVEVTLSQEIQDATNQIWGALGNSYCIYEGDKILVVDSLPKETATNVIMINNGGIAFSQTGINGTFNSAWTIDGTMNMQNFNVINLTANMIKGGTLKLGSTLNQSGILEVYNDQNTLIGVMDKNGLKMYGADGSYVLMNQEVGFAGYDRNNNQIFWADYDEFHMKKSVVEEEITLCNKLRFIGIELYDNNNNLTNDGIGLVSVGGNS